MELEKREEKRREEKRREEKRREEKRREEKRREEKRREEKRREEKRVGRMIFELLSFKPPSKSRLQAFLLHPPKKGKTNFFLDS